MKYSTELEWKYINYATELRKIKDGRYGRNIWFWTIRTYLAVSLWMRLFRLKMELKHGQINKRQYIIYSQIIHSAI